MAPRIITLHCQLTTRSEVTAEIARLEDAKSRLSDSGLAQITEWIIEGLRGRLEKLEKSEERK